MGLHGQALDHRFNGFKLVEDGAQHWLADDCVRRATTAISFDPTKNLANFGNGGAIVTDDDELAVFARDYKNNGKHLDHGWIGTNSRMSEIDCNTLLTKMALLPEWQDRRRAIAGYWLNEFENLPMTCMIDETNFDKHAFHKFVFNTNRREKVKGSLINAGIDARVHYATPLHEYGAYKKLPTVGNMMHASMLAETSISLPFYPELTDEEVEYIADTVRQIVLATMPNRTISTSSTYYLPPRDNNP
jgi:dTDP-4-amino-4,6-dideoxygalactose transaminase